MPALDKSLINEDIRARFFSRLSPIDRHGNFLGHIGTEDRGRTGFCTLLHYKLLDGMSDEDALDQMRSYNMSDIEANFTLKKAKEFISDKLEIDLDEIRSNVRSTARYIYLDVQKIMMALEKRYEAQRYEPIQLNERHFQADAISRQMLGQYIQSETAPEYWLDTANTRLEPFTLEECKKLLSEIVKRDQKLHGQMTAQKKELRLLAEQRDYDTIHALALEMGLE